MMQQYQQIKEAYPDTLLFYRLGDFYELFFEDAQIASRELEITLTGRNCGKEERAPMCGVPHHSAQGYIDRLIRKGYKVAICEQTEDPAMATGIVRREVVRVITPGTVTDSSLLDEKQNHYLAAITLTGLKWALAFADLSTGEMSVMIQPEESPVETLLNELGRIRPGEILADAVDDTTLNNEDGSSPLQRFHKWSQEAGIFLTDARSYREMALSDRTYERLYRQFQRPETKAVLEQLSDTAMETLAVLYEYIESTQKRTLEHFTHIQLLEHQKTMVLDLHTRQNLELTETLRDKQRKGTLLWVLDKTKTAMGGRMLRRWVEEPLLDATAINQRLDAVTYFLDHPLIRQDIRKLLQSVYDLERLIGKISFQTANPRDLLALKQTLMNIEEVQNRLGSNTGSQLIDQQMGLVDPKEILIDLLDKSIHEEAPLQIKDGGVIKEGYHQEIDELRNAAKEGKQWIATYEKNEREATGIKNLKTGFNRVFGYYIEVTKSNVQLIPDHYQRKQTLANCERYITDPLKDLEAKILGAEEKAFLLESRVFSEIRDVLKTHIADLQKTGRAISTIDAIAALAETAFQNRYQCPKVGNHSGISIRNGRHPVVEKTLQHHQFVPNDTTINQQQQFIHLITGPNMAGKSTYMRQVALIVLMAQMGSYVPADTAHIGVVDRVFTRIGASDDLSQGQSTFMVEMSEVSSILRSATHRSLIILDEVGRGTSTYDGLSIAWSVIDYLHENIGAKTLFSTHYHELTELEETFAGVANYRVAVKEKSHEVIFLRKVIVGTSDKSYGIQVAKLAGLPEEVLEEAKAILHVLENRFDASQPPISIFEKRQQRISSKAPASQILPQVHPLPQHTRKLQIHYQKLKNYFGSIQELDVMTMTPLEALNKLYELQKESMDLLESTFSDQDEKNNSIRIP
ncbi:DNA mismatch repair protein MutS [Anoxynatronum buryatiense]|uniref:DNA mismatch repair protein MutS n=2 Tax=Anoxynatronum buryatiense TaxID=489973 RepID=A0AA45WUN8_9CLOT|nr:DNA mismatch repair protein MutS [Anoxynatronum buryatiense]